MSETTKSKDMKRFILSFVALALCVSLSAQELNNRAEWLFSKNKGFEPAKCYLETGAYPSKVGVEGAGITFYHNDEVATPALNEKGYPTATSARGDYWLFEVPVKQSVKGLVVDAFIPFVGNEGEQNNFVLEYKDGKRWVEAEKCSSTESSKHIERLWQSVRFTRKNKSVALRLRQTSDGEVKFSIANPSTYGQHPQIIIYDNAVPRDTLKVLFLGNSYTYYHTYPVIFKEIAWREGHYADCEIFISGGYTMKAHLANKYSVRKVQQGGYDYVMLQDQSVLPMLNGTPSDAGSSHYVGVMVQEVKKCSPDAKVSLEITWGRRFGNNNLGQYEKYAELHPEFFASYDAMQNRLIEKIAETAAEHSTLITPVGVAWQIVMHERPDILLYHKDNHHQSYAGSYLSAAVAYLTIYGEKFGENAANCKLDAATAAYLRSVAERVVLDGEKWGKK